MSERSLKDGKAVRGLSEAATHLVGWNPYLQIVVMNSGFMFLKFFFSPLLIESLLHGNRCVSIMSKIDITRNSQKYDQEARANTASNMITMIQSGCGMSLVSYCRIA